MVGIVIVAFVVVAVVIVVLYSVSKLNALNFLILQRKSLTEPFWNYIGLDAPT